MTRFEPRPAIVFLLSLAVTMGCVSDDEGRNQSSILASPELTLEAVDAKPETKRVLPIQKKPNPNPTVPTSSSGETGANSGDMAASKVDGGTNPMTAAPPNINPQQYIFNRIIVKLNQENPVERELLVAAIEKKTGAEVEKTLGGPLNTVLVIFTAAIPPRNADAQEQLAKTLGEIPEIKSAQGDQLMQAR